jgi:O-antigen ligase
VAAIVAWGAIAFGAVYEWASRPLAVACLLCGGAMAVGARRRVFVPIGVGFAAVVAAVLLQQVPLSRDVIARVSPATVDLLNRYDVAFALGMPVHTLSIDPQKTWGGLLLLVSFGVFWIGLSARLTDTLARRIVGAVLATGLVIAVAGIVAAGDGSGKVYGWWQPESRAQPFGPFVNRNHFAGWMLMAIPLGAGYLLDRVARADLRRRSWRDRLVWLASPAAGRVVLTAFALAMMTLSVWLSLSRSGIACLSVALPAIGVIAAARLGHGWRRMLFPALILAAIVGSAAWVGGDALAARLQQPDTSWDERQTAWHDAVALATQFRWTGTGINTFRSAMLVSQTARLDLLFSQAHNDYLQLAAEGGVLVGAPALVLAVLVVARMRRTAARRAGGRTEWIRLGARIGLAAIALQELVDFSLQIPGNAALLCVLAAIAIYDPPPPRATPAFTA